MVRTSEGHRGKPATRSFPALRLEGRGHPARLHASSRMSALRTMPADIRDDAAAQGAQDAAQLLRRGRKMLRSMHRLLDHVDDDDWDTAKEGKGKALCNMNRVDAQEFVRKMGKAFFYLRPGSWEGEEKGMGNEKWIARVVPDVVHSNGDVECVLWDKYGNPCLEESALPIRTWIDNIIYTLATMKVDKKTIGALHKYKTPVLDCFFPDSSVRDRVVNTPRKFRGACVMMQLQALTLHNDVFNSFKNSLPVDATLSEGSRSAAVACSATQEIENLKEIHAEHLHGEIKKLKKIHSEIEKLKKKHAELEKENQDLKEENQDLKKEISGESTLSEGFSGE